MTLRIALRLARRELRGGLGGFRILLACIILGIVLVLGRLDWIWLPSVSIGVAIGALVLVFLFFLYIVELVHLLV